MTTPFRLVPRGLNLVTAGTVVVVLLWLYMVAAAFNVGPHFYEIRYLFLAALALGLGLAFAGRSCCLTLPPRARAARAWGVLAVILDGCGLFSAVTNFILAQAGFWVGPGVIAVAAILFSLGGLVLGRVAFHFYLWSLAKYIDNRTLAVRALTVFWHAVGVTAVIGLVTWFLSYKGMGHTLAQAWLVMVTLAILHWTWRYVRLLSAARAAVREYQPPVLDADDDPDREYREQYEQAVRDGLVSPVDD